MHIAKPQSKQPIPTHAERVFKGVIFDVSLSFDEFVEKVLDKDFADTDLKVKLLEAKLDSAKMDEVRKLLSV